MRGGGGGNFAIATEFEFSTEPAPDLTVFAMHFPAGSAADVLGAWQRWTADAPTELWTSLVISAGSPSTCRIAGNVVGSAAAARAATAQFAVAPSENPFVQEMGYLDAMKWFGGCPTDCSAVPRLPFVATSRMMHAPVDDPAAVIGPLEQCAGIDLLLDSLGGAVADVDPAATAFPHRGALASAQIYSGRPNPQVGELRDELGTVFGETGYVNYIDPSMPDWANAYYGANLARLRDVARRYDPDRVFAFPQAVSAG